MLGWIAPAGRVADVVASPGVISPPITNPSPMTTTMVKALNLVFNPSQPSQEAPILLGTV